VSHGQIADDEVLYRRIPPGKTWLEPPDRITSGNFKLRSGEIGISVYRAVAIDVADVLNKPEAIAGSSVAEAMAGQIRKARNGKGDPLGLDVIPVNEENDPGHAEIRCSLPSGISNSAARTLSKLFKLVQ
jgi:hypothetical protein